MNTYLILAGFVIGAIGLFRWLYKAVTGEKISIYNAFCLICLPSVIRFFDRRTSGLTEPLPDIAVRLFWFSMYIALFYAALRLWPETKPKHAWIIVACWVPLITITALTWYFMNQDAIENP